MPLAIVVIDVKYHPELGQWKNYLTVVFWVPWQPQDASYSGQHIMRVLDMQNFRRNPKLLKYFLNKLFILQ